MTGPDLRTKRAALNMTVADLARTLDVHPETVRNWERGRSAVPRTVELAMRWIAHERMMTLQAMTGGDDMNALRTLNRTVTKPNGEEIRIYDEYRFGIGTGQRHFDGYVVDNGRDRVHVQAWSQVEALVNKWGGEV